MPKILLVKGCDDIRKFGRQFINLIIFVALVWCVWIGVASDFYRWYFISARTQWLRSLYEFLDGRLLVVGPICLIAIFIAWEEIRRVLTDEDIRISRLGFIAILAILINAGCEDKYPRVIGSLRIDGVLNSLLISYLAVCLYGIVRGIYCKTQVVSHRCIQDSKLKGFTCDSVNTDVVSRHVKLYGEALVNQLMASIRENKQSLSVGITGDWGSGKSTFLNIMKAMLGDETEIVEFNPWMCQSPQQVTKDFFSSLRSQLSKRHSSLTKPISHYAKYLDKVRVSPISNVWLDGGNIAKVPSLYELKLELSSKFANLNKPVVIFIDDLDRLQSNEVFEVLRLIRNTADINNTIYVTAFDKEYVVGVLKNAGCDEPAEYLEKIFPIEIHLPKPEPYQIWDVFKADLIKQDNTERRFAENLPNVLKDSDINLILSILTSYRKAKRFSRLLMLNVNFTARNFLMDFKFLDFFWIELLQFYDKRTYDVLANDASTLLYYESISKRYCLRPGIAWDAENKNDLKNYNGKVFWLPLSPNILSILFWEHRTLTPMSISYTENYAKYFAIGLSAQRLSVDEFNALINGEQSCKDIIDDWCRNGKHINSIEHNLSEVNIDSLSESALFRYLQGSLYYGLKKQDWQHRKLAFLNKILDIRNFNNLEPARTIVLEWFNQQLADEKKFRPLSQMLNSLYAVESYCGEDPYNGEIHENIISNKTIKSLLIKIIESYLESHKAELNPTSILVRGNDLFRIFSSCCVKMTEPIYEEFGTYQNFGFDSVIKVFQKRISKPSIDEYEKCKASLFYKDAKHSSRYKSESNYRESQLYEDEQYHVKMISHFGSDFEKKLEEFKTKCFNGSDMDLGLSLEIARRTQTKKVRKLDIRKKKKKY